MTKHRVGPARPRRDQRGTSLLEALVGFLLVAVGLLGSAQLQLRLRHSVEMARQQADAVRLAQQELENLRAFASHEARPGLASFASITSQTTTSGSAPDSPAAYRVARQVRDSTTPQLKDLELGVDWTDRHGIVHRRTLFTVLGGQSPALILPLGQKPVAGDGGRVLGRHAAIPRDAHDLGNGRSVFKPVTGGSEAWLFDNRSGRIVVRCAAVPANRANRQLGAADLSDCAASNELLLGGRIRLSPSVPPALPDAADARAAPPAMSIALQLTSTGHPQPARCLGEAVRMVDIGAADAPHAIPVAIDATPASQGLAGWTDLADRFWRYHCAVSPVAAPAVRPAGRPHWTGRLQITPIGWTIGVASGGRRLCRYSADTDFSGGIDRAAESPDHPLPVVDALIEQNYLIVDGSQDCPRKAASPAAAGKLPWSDRNPATVPHPS